jgi:signal transduction histidine kinase
MTLTQALAPCDTEILPPLQEPAGTNAADIAIAAAGVLHDLGNLIQIATSALNILARTPKMPAAHRGPILHRARTCLDHAGTIVRQNIGRARDHPVAPARSDVAACLADVAAMVAAGEPRLAVALTIEPELPSVLCDPTGLRRAVLNLVLKARDAMDGTGIVTIEALLLAPDTITLRVGDQGIGMSPAAVARAFDPFFTTKNDALGGIGLPMVERFVRGAGGSVAIESQPDTGTTVTLRLPTLSAETKP